MVSDLSADFEGFIGSQFFLFFFYLSSNDIVSFIRKILVIFFFFLRQGKAFTLLDFFQKIVLSSQLITENYQKKKNLRNCPEP